MWVPDNPRPRRRIGTLTLISGGLGGGWVPMSWLLPCPAAVAGLMREPPPFMGRILPRPAPSGLMLDLCSDG
jgi:hypothetical protein